MTLAVCLFSILLSACKRDLPISNEVNSSNENFENAFTAIELPKPNIDYLNYINNTEENQEQKKFNTALYYLSKAIIEVCNDPNLISNVKSNFVDATTVSFDNLMKNADISLVIKNSLLSDNQTYEKLLLDLKLDGIDFYPTIELSNSNSENIKIAESPIICAGIPYEYYTNSDTLGGYIMAWNLKSEGSVEVLINEDKKNIISSPVFIVNGTTDYIAKVEIGNSMMLKNVKVEQSPIIQAQWNTQYSGFRIDYRYETDRYSNYRYTGSIQTTNGVYEQDVEGGLICNVHKNDIGKNIVPRWGSLRLNNSFRPEIDTYIESYYVTYEYDWYASFQFVTVSNTQLGPLNYKCRMRKSHEYYQIIRSVKNTHVTHYGKGFINIYNPCCLI